MMTKATTTGLPDGWKWLPLEKVADNLDNKRKPINAAERETRKGDVPYYGATGQVGWIDSYLLDEEVVLVGEDGAPFLEPGRAKAYMISGKSWVNNHAHILRARGGMPNAYLMHYLNILDYWPYVTGTTRLKLTKGAMNKIPVPVAPLPQQHRIVEAIELQLGRLDAAVARLQGAKARLKRYKQAVLKAAVDAAIETGDMVPLGDLIASIGQGWSPKCLNEPSPNQETWGVIKTTAIQPGAYVQEENKELPSALKPRPEHELKAGDLLVTRAGPRSRVGITCLVRETRSRLMNCDKAYRLRFDGGRVEPAYIEMLLNAPQITDQLDELKTGISDSGVNLTQGRFLSLEMPVIKLKAQRELIALTQAAAVSVDETEATLDAQLQQAVRLRQAVLKRAFEGMLG